ncbi:concanavalin A-like lectin/glucanase domain-containing protein [Trichoderma sp. TUCIM 5745]
MLGLHQRSWGYHGDDGDIYPSNGGGRYGPQYTKHDVIGCGVDFDNGVAFFTLNGKYLGIAFRRIQGKLYPAVSFEYASEGCQVLANFGQKPFLFDLSEWNAEEAQSQWRKKRNFG